MKRTITFLLGAAGLIAQSFSISPNSVTVPIREIGPDNYPFTITVTGTGTGTISQSCNFGYQVVQFSYSPNGTVVNPTLSFTAPGTIYATFYGFYTLNELGRTINTCTLTAAGTAGTTVTGTPTVAVTINITSALYPPTYTNGQPSNCTSQAQYYAYPICTVPNWFPGGTNQITSAPGTFNDATFGTQITSITYPNRRTICGDVIQSPVNLNGALVCNGASASQYGSGAYITGTQKGLTQYIGVDLYTGIPSGGGIAISWSGLQNYSYYYLSGLSVHKVALIYPPPSVPCSTAVTCWIDTIVATDPAPTGATSISSGDDGDVSGDDWWCVGEQNSPSQNRLLMINLVNGTIYTANFPASWAAWGSRNTQVTVKSPVTGKRYCLMFDNPGPPPTWAKYELANGATSLTFDGYLPQYPDAWTGNSQSGQRSPSWNGPTCGETAAFTYGACIGSAHSTVGIDGAGIPYDVNAANNTVTPYRILGIASNLDATVNNFYNPVEFGGGLYNLGPWGSQDVHTNCAKTVPVCQNTTDFNPTQPSGQVTGASGNPITITTNPAYNGANGDSVCINSVLGNLAANGCWIISNLSGSTFTIPINSNGSYTTSGGFIKNVATNYSGVQYPVETQILNLTNIKAPVITRLLQHQSLYITAYIIGYFGQGHGGLSGDGTLYCYDSNYGHPDSTSIYCALTGYAPGVGTNSLGTVFFGSTVIKGSGVIRD